MKFCPNDECPFYLEHGFVAEFEDSVERCADCQSVLVSEQPVFELEGGENSVDMDSLDPGDTLVTLMGRLHSTEAHIFRGKLEAEGIPAFVADEQTHSVYPNTFGGVRLMVRTEDFDQAAQILGLDLDQQELV